MNLSRKFEEALIYANQIHAGQIRRKTGMPRIAHLLAVTGSVLEHGGNEDEAKAALLHDAVEDAGGPSRLADIQQCFGEAVARIVDGCTERELSPRPPWKERKQAYVDHLREGSSSVMLVAAADKLHNARALRRDYRAQGEAVWQHYRGGKEGTLWYYRALIDLLRERAPAPLVDELQQVFSDLVKLTAAQS